jgi:aquaporin Z
LYPLSFICTLGFLLAISHHTTIELAIFYSFHSNMKKYFAELLGTMFLVMIAGFSGDPLAIGVWLAILVYATGPISGGHLNPAVTLWLLTSHKIKWSEAINYWVSQLLGAILGALVYRGLRGTTMSVMPADGISMRRAGLGEFIFTFMLAMVVYLTTAYKKSEGNQYRGAAIGLTIFVGAVSVGRMTGGAFNPAVSTGSILVDRVHGGASGMYIWMYLVATLLGWFVAGSLCKWLNRDT